MEAITIKKQKDSPEEIARKLASVRSMIGIIPNTGVDSVEEVRAIRRKLSKEDPKMESLKYV